MNGLFRFQSETSASCGKFVLYYVFERLLNMDIEFLELLEEIFKEDAAENERLVQDFYENILKPDNDV